MRPSLDPGMACRTLVRAVRLGWEILRTALEITLFKGLSLIHRSPSHNPNILPINDSDDFDDLAVDRKSPSFKGLSLIEGLEGRPRFRGLSLNEAPLRALGALGVEFEVAGPVPFVGLLVCNHLSYIDILLITACFPATFVAKREVSSWPVFGWFARQTGTIFVDRDRPRGSVQTVAEIRRALADGKLVVLFPEGTSSGGADVLPFKSSLLDAAADFPLAAAAISYALEPGDGDPAEEVCYWRDMTLVPHLIRLLGRRRIRAKIVFGPSKIQSACNRKVLARELHARVTELHGRGAAPVPTGPAPWLSACPRLGGSASRA
jgi:1-acyl-sn-glycerol-3-phosphate acyltransferase